MQLDDVVAVGGGGGNGTALPGSGGPGVRAPSGPGAVDISINDSEFSAGIGAGGPGAIELDGDAARAEVRNSRVSNQELSGPGMVLYEGATATLESVAIDTFKDGVLVYEGAVTIRRSQIQAALTALELEATDELPATAQVADSLLFSTQSPAATVISEGQQPSAALEAVGSTLVGRGKSAVGVFRGSESGPATAILRNSIVRHIPLLPMIPLADLQAVGGAIDADFSSFTTVVAAENGSVPAPGSAGNIAGDPLFVNAGKGDFNLQGTSPLIDRGNPALVGAGELDLLGASRSLDGNRDCAPVPDIGAYEVTGQGIACADPAPAISKFGITNKVFAPKGGKPKGAHSSARRKKVKRGTKFTYTLSEAAQVKITIERRKKTKKGKKAKFAKVTTLSGQKSQGRESTPFSGRVKGKPLKPGKYRATITAVDSAGQASAPRQLSFKIVAG